MARILVADDEEMVRDTMCGLLELAGHETIEASDGEEAIQHYRKELPDLVITDIKMNDPAIEALWSQIQADHRYLKAKRYEEAESQQNTPYPVVRYGVSISFGGQSLGGRPLMF